MQFRRVGQNTGTPDGGKQAERAISLGDGKDRQANGQAVGSRLTQLAACRRQTDMKHATLTDTDLVCLLARRWMRGLGIAIPKRLVTEVRLEIERLQAVSRCPVERSAPFPERR